MNRLKYFFVSVVILFIAISCKDDYRSAEPPPQVEDTFTEKYSKISHVTFYIENSGSMLGYVNGPTQFVNAVNDLAQFPNLVKDDIPYSYNLISGKEKYERPKDSLTIKNLGNSAEVLKSKLTRTKFETPSSGHSDLKNMFDIALTKAITDNISILISDCIYDLGGSDDPLQTLRNEATSTRTNFINRLKVEDIEALVIKLESDFDGWYHPADPSGKSTEIDQKRPYYVWVFGNSDLLKKYFPEERLERLEGYIDAARFRKLSISEYPYAAIGYDNDGFRENYKVENTFKLHKKFGEDSKFNIAVDFSNLNLSNSYRETLGNYSTSGSYVVSAVKRVGVNPSNDLKPYLKNLSYTTHIITVKAITPQPEMGEILIYLDKVLPKWIQDTNTDNDYPFDGSTTTTFGFDTLINGITEAYDEVSDTAHIATFKININN